LVEAMEDTVISSSAQVRFFRKGYPVTIELHCSLALLSYCSNRTSQHFASVNRLGFAGRVLNDDARAKDAVRMPHALRRAG
jgi:hypothetical protein